MLEERQVARVALHGCRAAIDKATAILLDQGQIGVTLGLDSACYAIDTAIAQAAERLKKWQHSLGTLGDGLVELPTLREHFDGVDRSPGGKFRAHLELTELTIALKKRVIVLQAVEHAQMAPANPFENFISALTRDQKDVLALESGVGAMLRRLSMLRVDRSHGLRDVMVPMGKVDELLRANHRLRVLGDSVDTDGHATDVAVEMIRNPDGSVLVLPAYREPA